jgi:hypothetical protein
VQVASHPPVSLVSLRHHTGERASGSFLLHGGSGGAAAPGASCDLQDEVYHSVVLLTVLLVTLLFLSLVLVFVSSPFL